jgi:hypothetical protein
MYSQAMNTTALSDGPTAIGLALSWLHGLCYASEYTDEPETHRVDP